MYIMSVYLIINENIMKKNLENNKKIAIFEWKEVRKTWYNNEWWFVVEDVVFALTESKDPKQYIQRLKTRDQILNKGWVQIVHTLEIITKWWKQKMNCSNTEWIFRLIQSIPSKKAEPFKLWLAKVWYERIQEIENPELAQERMKSIYEKKWYSKSWIDKRLRWIAVRQDLTEEWSNRWATKGVEYAILTNEIMQWAFWMKVDEYKDFKSLKKENLRDHMTDLELILTMLWEATTTKLTNDRDSQGFKKLKKDANDGWDVAGNTRKNIEKLSNKKVMSSENYLEISEKQKRINN